MISDPNPLVEQALICARLLKMNQDTEAEEALEQALCRAIRRAHTAGWIAGHHGYPKPEGVEPVS